MSEALSGESSFLNRAGSACPSRSARELPVASAAANSISWREGSDSRDPLDPWILADSERPFPRKIRFVSRIPVPGIPSPTDLSLRIPTDTGSRDTAGERQARIARRQAKRAGLIDM